MKINKICLNCGLEFSTEYKHRDKKYCNRKCFFEYSKKNKSIGRNKNEDLYEDRKCLFCLNSFNVSKKNKKKLCSSECRVKWAALPKNKNSRIEKSKKVLIDKYGVDSLFKLKSVQTDISEKIKDLYGVDNPMKNNEIVNKLKNTVKIKETSKLLLKLKDYNIKILDEYTTNKDGNTSMSYRFNCIKCDNTFTSTLLGSGKIPICRKCFPINKNSKIEYMVSDLINQHNLKFINNDRKVLDGKEIDIYIPSKKIGIEINGNYYHSELHGGKDKKYHLNKTELANSKGVRLIHIFEDEIILKWPIVESRLKNILGLTETKIYGRKCKIKAVSFKEKVKFLNDNHIQGNSIDILRYGLFYQEDLVALMTFGHERKSLGGKKNNEVYELTRFCNKLNTTVIGGFSKLLKHFIKGNEVNKITTFANLRWSNLKNNVYSNDFKFIHKSPPNYWYVKVGDFLHRNHRFNFRKDKLVKEGYDKNLTEKEIMVSRGYDRIWDCGNSKFEFVVTNTGTSVDSM